MTNKKFTFKKNVFTGKYSAFFPTWTDIKYDKKVVGTITCDESKDEFTIKFAVYKENDTPKDNCAFKWIKMKKKFDSELEARTFVNREDVRDMLHSKYSLYSLED